MGFLEVEDRVMRTEGVVFPAVWKRCGDRIVKGGLAIVQATVQHQDEDFKLIIEDVVPIQEGGASTEQLAEHVRRLRKQASARAARSTGAGYQPQASPQGAAARPPAQQPQQAAAAGKTQPSARSAESAERSSAAAEKKRQRIYIKIAASREHSDILEQLKKLLAAHHGQLDTVLFYEREQRLLALSETYRTKPSPQLFNAIEQLLGQGAVIVR